MLAWQAGWEVARGVWHATGATPVALRYGHAPLPDVMLPTVNRSNPDNAALPPSPSGACPWSCNAVPGLGRHGMQDAARTASILDAPHAAPSIRHMQSTSPMCCCGCYSRV